MPRERERDADGQPIAVTLVAIILHVLRLGVDVLSHYLSSWVKDQKLYRTDGDIRKAVKAWLKNPAKAEAKYGRMSDWDVSRVTNMKELFYGKSKFNQDLSRWDVSHVTSMKCMFAGATVFNQNLSRWDVSSVKDMDGMFSGATVFNQDLSQPMGCEQCD